MLKFGQCSARLFLLFMLKIRFILKNCERKTLLQLKTVANQPADSGQPNTALGGSVNLVDLTSFI